MSQDELKKAAAKAALAFVEDDMVLGVGTGSTVNHFIELLAVARFRLKAAVPSSEATAKRLRDLRLPVQDLNAAGTCDLYVDGADEVTEHLAMIKGGGGALTREKVVAQASRKFVCIADASKLVAVLGNFPLPVEVIPMARSFVAREIVRLGGRPVLREGAGNDNGHVILDVHGLKIVDPVALETELNQIPGIVTNGVFARRPADHLLLASTSGTRRLDRRR